MAVALHGSFAGGEWRGCVGLYSVYIGPPAVEVQADKDGVMAICRHLHALCVTYIMIAVSGEHHIEPLFFELLSQFLCQLKRVNTLVEQGCFVAGIRAAVPRVQYHGLNVSSLIDVGGAQDGVYELHKIRFGHHQFPGGILRYGGAQPYAIAADGGLSLTRCQPQRESGVAGHLLPVFPLFVGCCQLVKRAQQVQPVVFLAVEGGSLPLHGLIRMQGHGGEQGQYCREQGENMAKLHGMRGWVICCLPEACGAPVAVAAAVNRATTGVGVALLKGFCLNRGNVA